MARISLFLLFLVNPDELGWDGQDDGEIIYVGFGGGSNTGVGTLMRSWEEEMPGKVRFFFIRGLVLKSFGDFWFSVNFNNDIIFLPL